MATSASGRAQAGNARSGISDVKHGTDLEQYYKPHIVISAQARRILEDYSGLAPDDVEAHVESVRRRAFDAKPYICTGMGTFLDFITCQHPLYGDILAGLKQGKTFLDAGCCVGQDIRKLLFDGAPSSAALYGVDVVPEFFGLGKELFRDGSRLESKFFVEDLTKSDISAVKEITGKIDIINIQNVFHLFNLAESITLGRNLIAISKPVAGSIICGRQWGAHEGRQRPAWIEGTTFFGHNEETWRKLWADISGETGTKWEIQFREERPSEKVLANAWYSTELMPYTWSAIRVM